MKRVLACAAAIALTVTAVYAKDVKVSWYKSGHTTASGQRFNPHGLTAAHRNLPFGSKVKLTHKGRSVIVTINDRGPFIKGRTFDVSYGAAKALGIVKSGTAVVDAQMLGKAK